MSQLTMTQTRSRRRPRPRVSWGAAATSANLRTERRHVLAALAAEDRASPTFSDLSLADMRDRVVSAVRPLVDQAARAWSTAVAQLESGRARTEPDAGADSATGRSGPATPRATIRRSGRPREAAPRP